MSAPRNYSYSEGIHERRFCGRSWQRHVPEIRHVAIPAVRDTPPKARECPVTATERYGRVGSGGRGMVGCSPLSTAGMKRCSRKYRYAKLEQGHRRYGAVFAAPVRRAAAPPQAVVRLRHVADIGRSCTCRHNAYREVRRRREPMPASAEGSLCIQVYAKVRRVCLPSVYRRILLCNIRDFNMPLRYCRLFESRVQDPIHSNYV